jgi:membrane-bound lytic murein transglycosylase MltF
MREKAAALGLNPDRWFGNVEHAALAIVGQETVQYVRNIYKYYITCKSLLGAREARAAARQGAGGTAR